MELQSEENRYKFVYHMAPLDPCVETSILITHQTLVPEPWTFVESVDSIQNALKKSGQAKDQQQQGKLSLPMPLTRLNADWGKEGKDESKEKAQSFAEKFKAAIATTVASQDGSMASKVDEDAEFDKELGVLRKQFGHLLKSRIGGTRLILSTMCRTAISG
jgi:hypothetical protein